MWCLDKILLCYLFNGWNKMDNISVKPMYPIQKQISSNKETLEMCLLDAVQLDFFQMNNCSQPVGNKAGSDSLCLQTTAAREMCQELSSSVKGAREPGSTDKGAPNFAKSWKTTCPRQHLNQP